MMNPTGNFYRKQGGILVSTGEEVSSDKACSHILTTKDQKKSYSLISINVALI